MINSDLQQKSDLKKKSFLYSINPAIKIIAIIAFFKVIFSLDVSFFSKETNLLEKALFFGPFVFLILFLFFLLMHLNFSVVKMLKRISHLKFLILLSLIFHISLKEEAGRDISFQVWNVYLILFSLGVFYFVFKKIFPKNIYSFLFVIFFLAMPFLTSHLNLLKTHRIPFIHEDYTVQLFLKKTDFLKIILIFIRILLILTVITLFNETTSFMEINDGLEIVLKPLKKLKFPLEFFSIMISLIFMFIPFLMEETKKIIKAQMSRGLDLYTKNLFKKIYNLLSLLIPIFVISFQKSLVLANAMEARGYVLGEKRTKLNHYQMTKKDYLFLITILSFFIWSFF
ncbi:MAG: Energy-coupling factor transporter transmembrane protein EcfT [Candidatus Phytoplasma pruni]|nr:Energy-coupling factor transporter transmembrane protein EcfT [Candidatus Phytoplasma pruni]